MAIYKHGGQTMLRAQYIKLTVSSHNFPTEAPPEMIYNPMAGWSGEPRKDCGRNTVETEAAMGDVLGCFSPKD